MSQYQDDIKAVAGLKENHGSAWNAINPEYAARMRAQNKFKTGLDIAKYTAKIMRADMAAYDADPSKYTQSLGCWHGFIGQQKMISIKSTSTAPNAATCTCPAGWSPRCARSSARCRTSRCTKTSVSALIRELYTFLRQADARELGGLFALDAAKDAAAKAAIQQKIDNHVTHVVPSSPIYRRRFRQRGSHLPAGQAVHRSGCLLHPDRSQVSDEAMRPPGWQGHRAARGLPGQDPRDPLRLPGTGRGRRHHRGPYRLAGRRPDQADRRDQHAGRPWATSTTPSSTAKNCRPTSLGNGDVVIKRDGKLLRRSACR